MVDLYQHLLFFSILPKGKLLTGNTKAWLGANTIKELSFSGHTHSGYATQTLKHVSGSVKVINDPVFVDIGRKPLLVVTGYKYNNLYGPCIITPYFYIAIVDGDNGSSYTGTSTFTDTGFTILAEGTMGNTSDIGYTAFYLE